MTRPPRERKEKTQESLDQAMEIEEPARMWAKSVVDIEGEILCGKDKNKPSFFTSTDVFSLRFSYLELLFEPKTIPNTHA